MSTQIDERVVAMRFDNKQFEAGAAQSMSTLEKLKSKLDFTGAAKGFENLEKAANNVTLSGLSKSAEAVEVKFSTMSIVAMNALNRLVDTAIDSGTRMIKALSIDQVTAGFDKYEMKVQAVQTIMNATGKSIDEVNGSLNKLIWFTDETSYSFTSMIDNIGKFTSSGVDLEVAVSSMIGIANAAGLAGASVNDASHAMDGFSKAIAQGYMSRQNWQWIRTAHMDTAQFKESLIEAAQAEGTLVKAGEGIWKTLKGTTVSVADFETAMKDGWLTTKAMNRTLGEFGAFAEEVFANLDDYGGITSDAIEGISEQFEGIGKQAFAAAQEAKTFTDAINSVKDAVSSKWMTSFELIFGNYEEAKSLWTDVANELWDIFASSGEARNEMLTIWKEELGGRDVLMEGLGNAWIAFRNILDTVKEALSNVFPPMTADRLFRLTEGFRDLTERFKLSTESLETLQTVLELVLTPFSILIDWVKIGFIWTGVFAKMLFKLGDAFLASFSGGKQFENFLRNTLGNERYERMAAALSTIFEKIGSQLSIIGDKLKQAFSRITESNDAKSGLEKIKDILFAIGNVIIDGIVASLEILAGMDWTWLSKITDVFMKFFTSIDLGKIGLIVIIAALVKFGYMLFWFVNTLGWAVETFNEIGGYFGEMFKAAKWALLGAALIAFVTSLAVIISTLNNMNTKDLAPKIAALSIVFGELTAVFVMMSKMTVNAGSLMSAAGFFLTFGASLSLLLLAISALKTEGIAVKLGVITVLITEMTAVGLLMSKSTITRDEKKVTAPFLSFAISIGILVMALNGLSLTGIIQKITAISFMIAEMTAVGLLMSKSTIAKNEKQTTAPFLSFAISIGILVTALNSMNLSGILEKVGVLSLLMLEMTIIGKIMSSSTIAKNEKQTTAPFLSFAISIGILVTALNSMKLNGLVEKIVVISLIMAELVAVSKIMSTVKDSGKGSLALLAFTVSVNLIVTALNRIRLEGLIQKVLTLEVVMSSMVLIMHQLSSVKNTTKSTSMLLAFAVSVNLIIFALNNIDLTNLAEKIVTLGTVMTGLVLVSQYISNNIKNTSSGATILVSFAVSLGILTMALNGLDPSNALAKLTIITALITELTMVSKILSQGSSGLQSSSLTILAFAASISIVIKAFNSLDVTNIGSKIAVLSVVMVELGVIMALLKTMGTTTIMTAVTVVGMIAAIMVSLVAVFAVMNLMDSEKTLLNAVSLSAVLVAISGVMLVLSKANTNITSAAKAALALGAFVGVLGVLMLAFGALMNVAGDFVTKGAELVTLLGSLAPALLALELVAAGMIVIGAIGTAALPGIAAAIAIIGGLEGLLIAIGYVMSIPGVEGFIDKGVSFFGKLGDMIGGFLGSLIGSALSNLNNSANLPVLAENLSSFMTSLEPFLSGIENIPTEQLNAVTELTKTISNMSNIEINSDSMESFTDQLPAFGNAIISFCNGLKDAEVDANLVDSSANAAKALMALNENLPSTGGKLQAFMGQKDLSKFGEQLEAFGTALVGYYNTITKDGGIDSDVILSSASAGKALVELNDNLPATDGKLQDFLGQKDLAGFSKQLITFGEAIVAYNNTITKGDGINESAITSSANAGKALAELADGLQGQGGFLQDIFGSKDLSQFGEQLKTFGTAIKTYSKEVSGTDTNAVDTSVVAATGLVGLMNSLETSGGILDFFTGNKSLADFGVQLKDFGGYLKSYSDKVSEADFGAVNNSIVAIRSLIFQLAKVDDLKGTWSDKLKTALSGVANDGIDAFTEAVNNTKSSLKMLGTEVVSSFTLGISNGRNDLYNRGKEVAEEVKKALDNSYSKIKDSGEYLIDGLIVGMNNKLPSAESTASKIAKSLLTKINSTLGIKSPAKELQKTGKYTVEGLAKGINDNTNISNKAIANAGNGLVETIKNVLGIHSPSVVFKEEVGKWIVEGIIEGIKEDATAEEIAAKKATAIATAFAEALRKVDVKGQIRELMYEWNEGFYPEDMTDEQKKAKRVENLESELKELAEEARINLANYNALKEAGADQEKIDDAYIAYLKSRNNAKAKSEEIAELMNEGLKTEEENRQARLKVWDYLNTRSEQDYWTTKANDDRITAQLEVLNKRLERAEGDDRDLLLRDIAKLEKEKEENRLRGRTDYEKLAESMINMTEEEEAAYLKEIEELKKNIESFEWHLTADLDEQSVNYYHTMIDNANKRIDEINRFFETHYTENRLMESIYRMFGYDPNWTDTKVTWQDILKTVLPDVDDLQNTVDYWGDGFEEQLEIKFEEVKKKTTSSAKSVGSSIPASAAEGVSEGKDELSKAIDEVGEEVEKDSEELGKHAIRGAAKGVRENSHEFVSTSEDAASDFITNFDSLFEINSPSKVMEERGYWIVSGLAKGISENGQVGIEPMQNFVSQMSTAVQTNFSKETPNLATSFSKTISEAASKAEAIANKGTFTIRPVLDMSEVERQLKDFSSKVSSKTASSASVEIERTGSRTDQNGSSSTTVINNFNQTINTPKVASPIEVVRKTKNLMSQIVGEGKIVS